MQDRFKLRYYSEKQKKVYDVESIDFSYSRAYLRPIVGTESLMCQIDPKNLLQCSGLKDKNGRLIYEGDIIQTTFKNNSKITFLAVWDDEKALFNGQIIKREGIFGYFIINRDYLYYLLGDEEENCEVIGNKFEKP